jgi:hypothetical protein
VQAQKLLDDKEQEKAKWSSGVQKVLQVLLQAHDTQGDPIEFSW